MSDKIVNETQTENSNDKKLGLPGIIAIVVSAMIGGGVYDLPQQMAATTSAGAVIIAWTVTGLGMWFIVDSFRLLTYLRPDAKTGLYTYGELGFGKLTGFMMAWGYWLSNCFANVGYAILLMDSFNYFFPPYFKGGNNVASIIISSIILWGIYFVILRGVKTAAVINIIGTIGKLIPLIIFIVVALYMFNFSKFSQDMWGQQALNTVGDKPLGSVVIQVKNTMMVTLWMFIGIGSAVATSGRAKKSSDVGKATVLGFLTCLIFYVLLTVPTFGEFSQNELSKLGAPSTATALEKMVGTWGSTLMNVGVVVAILSSWLISTVILAELPFAAAKSGAFPKSFAKTNKNKAATFSLLVSMIIMQITLILVHFSGNAWDLMLSVTGIMVLPCYILCPLYLLKIAVKNVEYPENFMRSRTFSGVVAFLAAGFGMWLVYAAGINYLLVASIIYALGIPVFFKGRRDDNGGKVLLGRIEKFFIILIVIVSIGGVIYLKSNYMLLLK